jgi:hypothetical protein
MRNTYNIAVRASVDKAEISLVAHREGFIAVRETKTMKVMHVMVFWVLTLCSAVVG